MSDQSNLQKLEQVKDKLAEVYASEVRDDVHDNGNLCEMNQAILHVENALRTLKDREQQE